MNARSVSLVLTVIGDDRPGLVEQLATVISQHGGNWLESSMSHLGGKFAGIVRIGITEEQMSTLKVKLATLPGLRVSAEDSDADAEIVGEKRYLKLSLVGHDRIGIVREVSQVLARHSVNVESLNTFTTSAPMSAALLFHATADLTASPRVDEQALKTELEQLSNDLMVDITLDETRRD